MRRPPFKRGRDRGIPTQRLADLLQSPAGRHYAVGDAAWQAGGGRVLAQRGLSSRC